MARNLVGRLKERLAVLLIENERNPRIELDFEKLNNEIAKFLSSEEGMLNFSFYDYSVILGSNSCHLVITDVLFPCASHPKAFQFALDLMCDFFYFKDIDWFACFLPQRIARFLLKRLEESNDPTLDDQIKKCYEKFTDRIVGKLLSTYSTNLFV